MTDEGLERIEAEFRRNFEERGEIGAGASVWEGGEEVLSLVGGVTERGGESAWQEDTLVPIYSATKGASAVTLLMVLEREGIGVETEVRRIWPEFAGGGKGEVTLMEVLSHQGGVAALDERVEIWDHEATVRAIERQEPNWALGKGLHGYHPRTYGALLDELVRRLCGGERLGEVWRGLVGEPMGVDLWIGLPESECGRVARLSAPREMLGDEFTTAYLDRSSLTRRAFDSPSGMAKIDAMNQRDAWAMGNAAMGGVASARGLGKFYGLLGSGEIGGRLVGRLGEAVVDGEDLVLKANTAFSLGMMVNPGGVGGFGHPGAGGSLGLCDVARELGFGYAMNQLGAGALPGERPKSLARAVFL